MANLKEETLHELQEHGKTMEDVIWVGTSQLEIPLYAFWKEADRHYDEGYGLPEVNEGLLVVGEDWWLERHEYDGSEWWEYKEHPLRPHIVETGNSLYLIFGYNGGNA